MNREEAKALLPVMQAFADGKEVHRRPIESVCRSWMKCDELQEIITASDSSTWEVRIKPEVVVGWVNIYELMIYGGIFRSRKEALSCADPKRTACIRIEYTPGEGL